MYKKFEGPSEAGLESYFIIILSILIFFFWSDLRGSSMRSAEIYQALNDAIKKFDIENLTIGDLNDPSKLGTYLAGFMDLYSSDAGGGSRFIFLEKVPNEMMELILETLRYHYNIQTNREAISVWLVQNEGRFQIEVGLKESPGNNIQIPIGG